MAHEYYRSDVPYQLIGSRISDIPQYTHQNSDRPTDRNEIKQWKEHGGLLHLQHEDMTGTGFATGYLSLEAPFSLDELNFNLRHHKPETEVVIYRPPSWVTHRNAVTEFHPSAEICRSIYRTVRAHVNENMPVMYQAMAETLGFVVNAINIAAMEDDRLRELTGCSSRTLHYARKRLANYIRGAFSTTVWQIILRYEPKTPEQKVLWSAIQNDGFKFDKTYLITRDKMQGAARGWRRILKSMRREGFIEQRSIVSFYVFSGLEPDFNLIQHEHDIAIAQLEELTAWIDQQRTYP